MADLKYYDVILAPVITEKSMNAMADKKYTFYVHTDATKTRRRGYVTGKTAKRKKAIVQLTADSADIEIFAGL